jgi:WhiB family transcriptional regulator, redox-sensing transcriptional regulator
VVDPEIFYCEDTRPASAAKRICGACGVRESCLEYAIEANEEYGVWGGTSPRERTAIRMSRLREQNAKQSVPGA